jgi:hypothetical protein
VVFSEAGDFRVRQQGEKARICKAIAKESQPEVNVTREKLAAGLSTKLTKTPKEIRSSSRINPQNAQHRTPVSRSAEHHQHESAPAEDKEQELKNCYDRDSLHRNSLAVINSSSPSHQGSG